MYLSGFFDDNMNGQSEKKKDKTDAKSHLLENCHGWSIASAKNTRGMR